MFKNIDKDQRTTASEYLKKSIVWIYLFMLVIYGVIMVSLLASASIELSNLKDNDSYILAKETLNQWDQKLILDITAQNDECPKNYENLLDYQWAGTVDGCGCDFESKNVTQTIVVKGQCNSELLGFGCYDVDSQTKITASTWKNSKYLCAKRDSTYSLIDSLDQQCKLGDIVTPDYKKCGSDQRAVCRKDGDECPVTNIQLSQQIVGSSSGEIIEIDNLTEYVFYQDINGYMPVVSFRFDEHAHCLNQDQYNISPNKTGEYILLEKRRQNCFLEDPRPVEIDNIGEEDFYKANEEMWKVTTTKLPGYPRPSNQYNYKLSYMPYPYWSFACRNSDQYNLKNAQQRLLLENESDEMSNLVIVTIISVVFVSLVLPFLDARKEYYRQIELVQISQLQKNNKKLRQTRKLIPQLHKSWKKQTISIMIVDKIFKFVNIVNIFLTYVEIANANDWFEQVQSNECGDEFFNQYIFPDYMRSINQTFQYLGAMLGLWWFIISVDVLIILFRYLYQIVPTNKSIKQPFPKQLAKKKKMQKHHDNSYDMDDDIQDDEENIMDDGDSDEYYDDDEDDNYDQEKISDDDEIKTQNEIDNLKKTQKHKQTIQLQDMSETKQQIDKNVNKQPKRQQRSGKFEL